MTVLLCIIYNSDEYFCIDKRFSQLGITILIVHSIVFIQFWLDIIFYNQPKLPFFLKNGWI